MISSIPVNEALDLMSGEAMVCAWGDTNTVRDGLDVKRSSPHYQDLVADIRAHGFRAPVLIRTSAGGNRVLAEGHHRVTAAFDLGLDTVPFVTNADLFHRIDDMRWQLLSHDALTDEGRQALKVDAAAGLAVALHDATGWPLIEVGHCDGLPIHFLVRTPNGRLLDVEGFHTDDDLVDEYDFVADDGDVTLTEVTRDAVLACYRDDCGEPVPMPVIHIAAAAVLRQHSI
ncbi:MAG: ParB/Srx family N-terminal domain-containing protein [Pseudonocardia sp.]